MEERIRKLIFDRLLNFDDCNYGSEIHAKHGLSHLIYRDLSRQGYLKIEQGVQAEPEEQAPLKKINVIKKYFSRAIKQVIRPA